MRWQASLPEVSTVAPLVTDAEPALLPLPPDPPRVKIPPVPPAVPPEPPTDWTKMP
jgi:hypothetical protein